MKYEELLQLATLDMASSAALDRFGMLIDLAHARRDPTGTEHALTIATTAPLDQWSSSERATFYYFLANAHDDLWRREAKTLQDRWEWHNDHVEQSLLSLRRATHKYVRIIAALPEETRLGCCRRSNAIDTLKTHRSAVGNNNAVWFRAAAFAYETNPDLVGRMRPFARSCGILRDDAVADCDAFITNECGRAGDELSHGALRSVAERATMLPPLEE
jgi:hypothetical protein